MSLFSKRMEYNRVCRQLETVRTENNILRVELNLAKDKIEKLRAEAAPAESGETVVISAPAPEKKRAYVMTLQKEIVKYIKEDGKGNIYIKVVNEKTD